MTYGTVKYWSLVINGVIVERFHSWEAATDAFREAVKANPVTAKVYAVQSRGRGQIKTWDYEATAA